MAAISQEISAFAMIVAAILLAAVVCGVIFWGLSGAKEVADIGYTKVMAMEKQSEAETVKAFVRYQEQGMPAAACYTLIKETPFLITRLTCHICFTDTSGTEVGDCLKNHMRGRVKLILMEEESGGTYTAVLNGG